jgi:hypothetical protein
MTNLTFGINVSTGRLYTGHRYVYVRLLFGKSWLYAERWDTARAPGNRFKTRDGLVGWTFGVSTPAERAQRFPAVKEA